MTHDSLRYNHNIPRRRAGFTLIEMLIVAGILVLLTALSLAALVHVKKSAAKIRIKSDLALIDTALTAYKDEFGNYPQFADPATDIVASATNSGGSTWLDNRPYRGAVLLCRALIGPNNAVGTATDINAFDGADGPGFRTRGTTGKVYGP